jgi:hypothetical protein
MRRLTGLVANSIVACAAALASPAGTAASESCYGWATELVRDAQHCVSSVLRPQLGFNHGPDNLFTKRNAWCEGAPGPGIGQWIAVRLDPPLIIRTIHVVNGYVRSPRTFADNGRVKQFAIETSNGFVMKANLEDRADEQIIRLPREQRAAWIKFTIAGVYPGRKHANTCVSGLMVDIEEYQR